MQNDIIRKEFEKIEQEYGEDAFEENKKRLFAFIKQQRLDLTYSVKYYGVNEGQIGILSRRVPFDECALKKIPKVRLPKAVSLPHLPPIVKRKFMEPEFEEVEVTDDEDDNLPDLVSKPKPMHLIQGKIGDFKKENVNLYKVSEPELQLPKRKTKTVRRKVVKSKANQILEESIKNSSNFDTAKIQMVLESSESKRSIEPPP